jgi:putative hydrolase of the HAD superfamily
MTAIRLAAPDLGDHLSFDPDTGWTGPTITTLAELPHLLARAPALINT